MNRREMMSSAAAFALLAGEKAPAAFAQAIQEAPLNAVDVADYWTRFYDGTTSLRGSNEAPLAMKARKTLYLHSPESNSGLDYADNLPRSVLPALNGDVLVKMSISQYRPGKGDVSDDTSHFRIDATQTFDYMNLIAPLSWATIASITPDKQISKLPTIDQLGFKAAGASASDSSVNLKQVVLPSGVGKFAVNITRPANDTFTKIVSSASTTVTAALSMMTLPAISVPAVKVFSQLFGKWQSHATVIMNGNLTPVIATSSPLNIELPQDPMPFKSGYYVMFPHDHKPELDKEFANLTIQNGFLVHKDSPSSDDLETRAKNAVPGVSYATLRIYTSLVPPAAGCGTKPA